MSWAWVRIDFSSEVKELAQQRVKDSDAERDLAMLRMGAVGWAVIIDQPNYYVGINESKFGHPTMVFYWKEKEV